MLVCPCRCQMLPLPHDFRAPFWSSACLIGPSLRMDTLQDTLEPDELAWLSQRRHKPQAVSQMLTEALWRIRMPAYQKAIVDTHVLTLVTSQAAGA